MLSVWPLEDDGSIVHENLFYNFIDSLFSEGIFTLTDLAISSPSGLQVQVAPGAAVISYDSAPGGKRIFFNDSNNPSGIGTPNFDWISTVQAANPVLPRIDRVVAVVQDKTISGGGDTASFGKFNVIPGTPTAGATLVNMLGAPAVPSNCILLANIRIPPAATTIVSANIDTTVRVQSKIGGGILALNIPVPVSDYHEVTSDQTITSGTLETAPATIFTFSSLTFDGVGTFLVEVFFPLTAWSTNSITNLVALNLWDGDSADLGRLCEIQSGNTVQLAGRRVFIPPAGTRAYKVKGWVGGPNNAILKAGAGGAGVFLPGFAWLRSV